MSKQVYAFTVYLEREIGEDQTEMVTNAIKGIKFVREVKPLESNSELMFAEMRALSDVKLKLYDLIKTL